MLCKHCQKLKVAATKQTFYAAAKEYFSGYVRSAEDLNIVLKMFLGMPGIDPKATDDDFYFRGVRRENFKKYPFLRFKTSKGMLSFGFDNIYIEGYLDFYDEDTLKPYDELRDILRDVSNGFDGAIENYYEDDTLANFNENLEYECRPMFKYFGWLDGSGPENFIESFADSYRNYHFKDFIKKYDDYSSKDVELNAKKLDSIISSGMLQKLKSIGRHNNILEFCEDYLESVVQGEYLGNLVYDQDVHKVMAKLEKSKLIIRI